MNNTPIEATDVRTIYVMYFHVGAGDTEGRSANGPDPYQTVDIMWRNGQTGRHVLQIATLFATMLD